MKVIHKYQLNSGGRETQLALKRGYRVVHAEYVLVEKSVFVWVEEPLAAKIPTEEVELVVVPSGEPIGKSYEHVVTAVDALAPEAYHIFQKIPETAIFHPLELPRADFSLANAS